MTKPVDPASAGVYESVGESGIRQLVAAFYRQVPTDELLGPMYPADRLMEAESRLAEFLIFRFGGPETYLQHRGHPRLRIRHASFAITPAARDHWVALMDRALTEVGWSERILEVVQPFLHETATFLINRT